MEDKYFDIDEMMVDYSEMTSFDFESANFLETFSSEYAKRRPSTFKYGNYDVLDMLKSMFTKATC